MATHSSSLAWKIPLAEEPGGLQSMGSPKSQTRLSNFTFTFPFSKNVHVKNKGDLIALRSPGQPRALPPNLQGPKLSHWKKLEEQ